jgi:aspartokinase
LTNIAANKGSAETEFEKRRGVSRVEVRHGFAQVHVSRLATDVMRERLKVLSAVAAGGISIDFLKLTPSGMSFLVPEQDADVVEEALRPLGHHFSVRHDRSIVLVYAVSIRDEEGLIAGIVHTAITNGVRIDHVGDMHDRMLMVVMKEDAERLASYIHVSEHASGKDKDWVVTDAD